MARLLLFLCLFSAVTIPLQAVTCSTGSEVSKNGSVLTPFKPVDQDCDGDFCATEKTSPTVDTSTVKKSYICGGDKCKENGSFNCSTANYNCNISCCSGDHCTTKSAGVHFSLVVSCVVLVFGKFA